MAVHIPVYNKVHAHRSVLPKWRALVLRDRAECQLWDDPWWRIPRKLTISSKILEQTMSNWETDSMKLLWIKTLLTLTSSHKTTMFCTCVTLNWRCPAEMHPGFFVCICVCVYIYIYIYMCQCMYVYVWVCVCICVVAR